MADPIQLPRSTRLILHLCVGMFVVSLCLPVEATGAHAGPVIGLGAWIASLVVVPLALLSRDFHFAYLCIFLGGVANIAFIRATIRAYQSRPISPVDLYIGIAGAIGAAVFLIWRGTERDDLASYIWFASLLMWSIRFSVMRKNARPQQDPEPLIESPQLSWQ